MSKSKVNMPKELKRKCNIIIHSATGASAVAGLIPIPMSDAIPITAAQIGMIIKIGDLFDISLSEAAAKSIAGVALTQQAGRSVASGLLKMSWHVNRWNYKWIYGCGLNGIFRMGSS